MFRYSLFFLIMLIGPLGDSKAQKQHSTENALCEQLISYHASDNFIKTFIAKRRILRSVEDFESLVQAIQTCPFYSEKVARTGFIEWEYKLDSLEYHTIVIVPNDYHPEKRYPVSFIFHGGVTSANPKTVKNYIQPRTYNLNTLERIVVYPSGWALSPWWSESQVRNMQYLFKRIKRNYNIDENRVHLSGISDGGTGVFYIGNVLGTPWSAFCPYISNPLGVMQLGKQPVYLSNFKNHPFLIISTDQDQLFPPGRMKSFLKLMDKSGNHYKYYLAEGFEHEMSWYPDYEDIIIEFLENNPRNPYPDTLFWQTHNVDYGRNYWVRIDRLKKSTFSASQDSLVLCPLEFRNGARIGKIQVYHKGNHIFVNTNNIRRYTLFLSTEMFDFDRQFMIYTNGKLSYQGTLKKDPSVLLKWFKKDIDRTMLFGAEMKVSVE